MPSSEIITIGTEILLGEIVDTNTRYTARTLRGLGVDLFRTITIGDNIDRIANEIKTSLQHTDIIITTGGLGPTVDDPTREAVAKSVDTEVEFREELWQQVVASIARYGRKPTDNQKRQAFVPKGSIALPNPVGTAPSFIVEHNNKVVISLPGVPGEMEHILHESVIPYLQNKFDLHEIIKVRLLHVAGLGEGMIDDKIGDLETLTNPTVGLAAHSGVVDVRITAKAEDEATVDRMIAQVENDVRTRLGVAVFGADEDTLEKITLEAVESLHWDLKLYEFGLPDNLTRKIPVSASLPDLKPGALSQALRAAQTDPGKTVLIGVAVFPDERAAEIEILTPNGSDSKRITYGGPQKTLSRWAFNNALNILRLMTKTSSR